MMGHEWLTGVGLIFLGIITGFVGTNTGGSVFLTVPVMIWLGIAPQSSIATARLASVGTMVAGLRTRIVQPPPLPLSSTLPVRPKSESPWTSPP